ncbi:alpha/beta fold hydrolase [Streptomyces sp. NPDC060030]|uniref:alpha/beta fold hydrolase n=1 Tax=Streptomyces sp. NPDC060030 TaxID=3347042 RepID=UPI0036829EE0
MPAVLIHGVPDTHRVWDRVREHLTRKDVEAWDLPGFGAPRPADFRSTKEEYVEWLIARLEQVGEPVDLVGHDWGCILTARVASLRPDLVRTWAGGNGPLSARYVWHPLAEIWQTEVQGERYMQALQAEAFVTDMAAGFDLPEEAATEAVAHLDEPMKESILRLYRSALVVGQEWEPELAKVTAPALVFWGALDPACQIEFADELGRAMRATRILKLDCNHWTVLQKPAAVATALEEHWRNSARR